MTTRRAIAPNQELLDFCARSLPPNEVKAAAIARIPIDTRSELIVAKELSKHLLTGLMTRRICAVHIPGYCDPDLATLASRRIEKISTMTNWHLRGNVRTDMHYGIGFPLQMSERSEAAYRHYRSVALANIRKVRGAFAPSLSPMDRLRLEIDEVWPNGASVRRFDSDLKTSIGIVRIMTPQALFSGIAGTRGVCHVDSGIQELKFSSNIYLRVPDDGGELFIWNIPLNRKTFTNPIYRLISTRAFEPEIQEILHRALPPPLRIKPKAGDLVILDSSRPHSVAGFKTGQRMSIQSFMTPISDTDWHMEMFS